MLSDYVTGKHSRAYAGAPGILSDENEVEILIICQVLAEMGFSSECILLYVDSVIQDYLAQQGKPNPFVNAGMLSCNRWPMDWHEENHSTFQESVLRQIIQLY